MSHKTGPRPGTKQSIISRPSEVDQLGVADNEVSVDQQLGDNSNQPQATFESAVADFCPKYKDQIFAYCQTLKNLEENGDEHFRASGENLVKEKVYKNWSKFLTKASKGVGNALKGFNAFYETKKVQYTTNYADVISAKLDRCRQNPNFYQEMVDSLSQEVRLLERENEELQKTIQNNKINGEATQVKREFGLDIKNNMEHKKEYLCSLEMIEEETREFDELPQKVKDMLRTVN